METKAWYLSKVLWVNAVTAISVMLAALIAQPDLLPPQWAAYAASALAVVNVLMRILVPGNTKLTATK